MSLGSLPRLLRTARYLRWSQIGWRLRKQLRDRLSGWIVRDRVDAEAPDDVSWPRLPWPQIPPGHRVSPGPRETLRCLERGEFCVLGNVRRVGFKSPDWHFQSSAEHRLWSISLHYHDWAWALAQLVQANGPDSARAESLLTHYLSDWISQSHTRPARDCGFAWNPYAVATRITWWIRTLEILRQDQDREASPFVRRVLSSLAQQAAYLEGNLEWDLRNNHLIRDAVGLAWAGRYFEGPAPRRWRRIAAELAAQQIDEQILPDGGHCERSPMYHLDVMQDVLNLALLVDDADLADSLRETWERMARMAQWWRMPDGNLPALNDGEPRLVDKHLELCELLEVYLPELTEPGRHFPDTGIIVWRGVPWHLVMDVGPLGPDYQPGHGHADTLSLLACYRGQPLFVDPGCFGYDDDGRRRYDRSTAAHNTVCVDRQDSSEVWHVFRVGRRAQVRAVQAAIDDDALMVSAMHDGYAHLDGSPLHHRFLEVEQRTKLTIRDMIAGHGHHEVTAGFLLDPTWRAEVCESGWRLTSAFGRLRVDIRSKPGVAPAVAVVPWHPHYGKETTTQRLHWRFAGRLPLEVRLHIHSDD
jgi:uncharacterized heparinase superfamily protein